jgi:hypothetical protein
MKTFNICFIPRYLDCNEKVLNSHNWSYDQLLLETKNKCSMRKKAVYEMFLLLHQGIHAHFKENI